jgi:hypothetical protein
MYTLTTTSDVTTSPAEGRQSLPASTHSTGYTGCPNGDTTRAAVGSNSWDTVRNTNSIPVGISKEHSEYRSVRCVRDRNCHILHWHASTQNGGCMRNTAFATRNGSKYLCVLTSLNNLPIFMKLYRKAVAHCHNFITFLGAPCYGGPCHHNMAGPRVSGGRNGLQIWRIGANMLNKQSRTEDGGEGVLQLGG